MYLEIEVLCRLKKEIYVMYKGNVFLGMCISLSFILIW